MAISQPDAGDFLDSPDHSLLHRIIAADVAANVQSIGVNADGSVLLKNGTNSTTAFQVQASDASVVFNVDTTNEKCEIGGELDMNSNKIVEVTDPSADQDAATKVYVDNSWTPAGETWTYASTDDPTYTFTIASFDATAKYSPGMRIKLTDSGTQYFIITKVVFDDPGSTITVYGGIDYDLSTGTITNPFYSHQKAPLDFPLDPNKWTIEVTDTADGSQSGAVQNTWYNLNTTTIDVPIGAWRVYYQVLLGHSSSGNFTVAVTLSTANNSESDTELSSVSFYPYQYRYVPIMKEKFLILATKDTLYLNTRTITTGTPTIKNLNATNKLVIRAICAYL